MKKLVDPGSAAPPWTEAELERMRKEAALIKAAEKWCHICHFLGGRHSENCSVAGPS